jgi:hypothetical protein
LAFTPSFTASFAQTVPPVWVNAPLAAMACAVFPRTSTAPLPPIEKSPLICDRSWLSRSLDSNLWRNVYSPFSLAECPSAMNVRGFDAEGEITELQVTGQNETISRLSMHFSDAISRTPSVETEESLGQIIRDLPDSEAMKAVRFDCQHQIVKSKIARHDYQSAIPLIIDLLKIDEMRVDIWVDLGICAHNIKNGLLLALVERRLEEIRPQFQSRLPAPQDASLQVAPMVVHFIGYSLVRPCWRLFFNILHSAIQSHPDSIPVFDFPDPSLSLDSPPREYDIERPGPLRFQSVPIMPQYRTLAKLGDQTLLQFFSNLICREFTKGRWTFSDFAGGNDRELDRGIIVIH